VLHLGLDLSRKRVDVCLISDRGELIGHLRAPADRDGLYGLARRVAAYDQPVRGVVESMNGARHWRRARAASPYSLGSVVSPQPEVVAPPHAVGERPAEPAGGREPRVGRPPERSRRLAPAVGASYPAMGTFRTLNWTLNAEGRPQRERKAAGRPAQNASISRQNVEMARPGIEPGTPRFSGSRHRGVEAPETA
jgi:hypothetical protein